QAGRDRVEGQTGRTTIGERRNPCRLGRMGRFGDIHKTQDRAGEGLHAKRGGRVPGRNSRHFPRSNKIPSEVPKKAWTKVEQPGLAGDTKWRPRRAFLVTIVRRAPRL